MSSSSTKCAVSTWCSPSSDQKCTWCTSITFGSCFKVLMTSVTVPLSGAAWKNKRAVSYKLRTTLNKINKVNATDNSGSRIGKFTNCSTMPTISTATQPNTSSIKCQLITRSFSDLPSDSL